MVSTPERRRVLSRPTHRALAVSAFLVGLATAQPVFAEGSPTDTVARRSAVFSEIFNDIQGYYIDPEPLPRLAQEGLDALGGSGDVFRAEAREHVVAFYHRGSLLGQTARPADDDADGWGAVMAVGAAKAKDVTPGLADSDADELDQTMIAAMLKHFDRFSRYSGPDSAQAQRDNRDGFGGVGIGIDQADALPRVTDVFPGSPAEAAGIAIGDHLVAVDGKLLQGMSREATVGLLRGPINSTVDIAVRRGEAALPATFRVTRALIVPPTIHSRQLGHGITAIRISEFNAETVTSFDIALLRSRRETPGGLRGVVIDLRGNPGGLLAKGAGPGGGGGVEATSLLLDRGDIVSARGRNPASNQHFVAVNHDVTEGVPVAVLVNGGSASAAEVMAAALQDQGRAVVIGSSSYGKGTVQEVNDLKSNGAELTLTWARLYPPDGYLLHGHGVIPQFCTSGTTQGVDAIIAQGLHPPDSLLERPRASLDEAQWARLRAHCPPVTGDNAHDLEVAERVLGDPVIYRAALRAPTTTIARRPGD